MVLSHHTSTLSQMEIVSNFTADRPKLHNQTSNLSKNRNKPKRGNSNLIHSVSQKHSDKSRRWRMFSFLSRQHQCWRSSVTVLSECSVLSEYRPHTTVVTPDCLKKCVYQGGNIFHWILNPFWDSEVTAMPPISCVFNIMWCCDVISSNSGYWLIAESQSQVAKYCTDTYSYQKLHLYTVFKYFEGTANITLLYKLYTYYFTL